ncbi:MAG: glutathione S-transferase family protein [Myxococcales bacterium]|nr:MAG: glutathione S-transferase family protein [Myxococcales bacterium]
MSETPVKPLIYCFSGSPFVWRALIALQEKGIGYEAKWISRMSGEHRSPEMLALNPRGRLPILRYGDVTLYESMAICLFLELEHPEPPLIPRSTAGRARTLVLASEASYLESETDDAILFALGAKTDDGDPEPRKAAFRKVHTEMARWEIHLGDGGDYFVGDDLSLADVVVFPGVAFLVRTGLTLSKRTPRLAAWYERMVERPSVRASWPPHWLQSEGVDAGYDKISL